MQISFLISLCIHGLSYLSWNLPPPSLFALSRKNVASDRVPTSAKIALCARHDCYNYYRKQYY